MNDDYEAVTMLEIQGCGNCLLCMDVLGKLKEDHSLANSSGLSIKPFVTGHPIRLGCHNYGYIGDKG